MKTEISSRLKMLSRVQKEAKGIQGRVIDLALMPLYNSMSHSIPVARSAFHLMISSPTRNRHLSRIAEHVVSKQPFHVVEGHVACVPYA